MKILLDECVDQKLRLMFAEHDCQTAAYAKLAGLKTPWRAAFFMVNGGGSSRSHHPKTRSTAKPTFAQVCGGINAARMKMKEFADGTA